jgi:hypothetical protein
VSFKDLKKFCEPGGVSGPGRASDEIAVDDGAGEVDGHESSAGEFDLRRAGGVCVQLSALQDPGSGQQLRTVAEGGDGFCGAVKMADDIEDFGVEAEVFRG